MAKIGRPGLPSDRRQQVWEMWRAGSSISEISREVGSPPGSIFSILLPFGGIYRPPQRRRPGCLTLADREEISRGLAAGESARAIGRRLGRPASTVTREVARNKGRRRYRAVDADDRAWRRARRPQRSRLAKNPVLRCYVAARLRDDWSPEQIAGTLRRRYPPGHRMRISHESIYKSVFIQSRGVLPKDLQRHLRTRRPIRRSVHNTVAGQWRSRIIDAVSISQRPGIVDERVEIGHWEGDLVCGRHWSQCATLVERVTGYTVLVQLDNREAGTLTTALEQVMNRLPGQVRRTLTWDRGMELAGHKQVSTTTGMRVYFADPHSPWQRGTNENTNGLLRQYFPKGTSMAGLTQTDLDAVADKLNTRPRKRLGYRSPADMMAPLLH
ncbi:IS30 family transposase [Gordonia sp. FQ]|uniref:IS30 family transposase n=1 Tax=Gordonia sp. FQ TaxID=3446634 RepID=UPI003F879BA1